MLTLREFVDYPHGPVSGRYSPVHPASSCTSPRLTPAPSLRRDFAVNVPRVLSASALKNRPRRLLHIDPSTSASPKSENLICSSSQSPSTMVKTTNLTEKHIGVPSRRMPPKPDVRGPVERKKQQEKGYFKNGTPPAFLSKKSVRRPGSKGSGSSARRCLFGKVDSAQLQKDCAAIMNEAIEKKSMRWGFDFRKGTPLETSSPNISWEVAEASPVAHRTVLKSPSVAIRRLDISCEAEASGLLIADEISDMGKLQRQPGGGVLKNKPSRKAELQKYTKSPKCKQTTLSFATRKRATLAAKTTR